MLEEELVEGDSKPDSNASVRHDCESVRTLLSTGEIDAAAEVASRINSIVVQDDRLLFRLKKQLFVEHLRAGTKEAEQRALDCLRRELAPLALYAFPEAFLDFKRSMLMLVYGEGDAASPVAKEWSAAARSELAGMVCRTLRQAEGVQSPTFVRLLRYLLFTFRQHHSPQPITSSARTRGLAQEVDLINQLLRDAGVLDQPGSPTRASPVATLTADADPTQLTIAFVDTLLLCERDAPPLPNESNGAATSRGFCEADIQSLKEAVGLTRQEAVQALRQTQGDVIAAFKNELDSLHLNMPLVEKLVWEYAAYRDLLQEANVKTPDPQTGRSNGHAAASASDGEPSEIDISQDVSAMEVDDQAQQTQQDAQQAQQDAERRAHADTASPRSAPAEHGNAPGSGGKAGRQRDSSAPKGGLLPSAVPEDVTVDFQRQEGRSPPHKVARWHGRNYRVSKAISAAGTDDSPLKTCKQSGLGALSDQQKFALVLQLKRKVEQGLISEVLRELENLDAGFLEDNPAMLFGLQRCQFYCLVEEGKAVEALKLARSSLTPLATRQPHLQAALKATLAALLPGSGAGQGGELLRTVAAALHAELRAALGLQEPLLIRLMKILLETHTKWFRLQRCKDRFEAQLSIAALKASASGPPPAPQPPGRPADHGGSSDVHMRSDAAPAHAGDAVLGLGNAPANDTQSDDDDDDDHHDDDDDEDDDDQMAGISEESVLLIMEVTGMSRPMAIEMLAENDGNTDAVLAQLFP
ncbi:hypothetical protein WJX72_003030 [[Myrmecia] bisecta]|uniref:CTLH domain-containing protein n=1 Tax=[Myrmecia] bisecta TaxID=41462 RepID=A0AAW1PT07_9CHLO